MRVGTYPTRNFARLIPPCFQEGRTLSWLTSIHLTGDGAYALQSLRREVFARLHHPDHLAESLKFHVFPGLERVLFKERDDVLNEVVAGPDAVCHPVAVIHSNHSTAEESLQRVEQLHIGLVLYDGEFREYLYSGLHFAITVDRDVEAAFTIHKSYDPFWLQLHWSAPNVKSLRVPSTVLGLPCGLSPCPSAFYWLAKSQPSTERLCEEIPAFSLVLLRLALYQP